jgi:hypothetical protein
VIVMGGSGAGSGSGSDIDPSQGVEEVTLVAGTPVIQLAHVNLLHGRWNHTATRIGDDVGAEVLVAGGLGSDNGSGATAPVEEAEVYKPLTDQLSTSHPKMNVPRWGHRAILMIDGSVLIIGGVDKNGAGVPVLESFTLDGGFAVTGTLPSNAGLVDFSATSLPDGRVLITGGRPAPGAAPVPTAFILQLNTDTGMFEPLATDHLAVPRAGHGATLLCDGTVLISGGTDSPAPAERYNPPALNRR